MIFWHEGIVGLSAVVAACPYDIPPHLPPVLMVLADHLHDPQPISGTVKLVLQDFKRTHQDNWAEHKVWQHFSNLKREGFLARIKRGLPKATIPFKDETLVLRFKFEVI